MTGEQFFQWCKTFMLDDALYLGRPPLVMGIVNVTPDSFYDGGANFSIKTALRHALKHVSEGADIIDVGGESTRPGALVMSLKDELARVIPVIKAIRAESDICISIDSYKPEVMQQAAQAGANMVNDVRGMASKSAQKCLADLNLPVCIMHMQGMPQGMQQHPFYKQGVVGELLDFFHERIEACLSSGINRENLILDVGIGFGKTVQHNLSLIQAMNQFKIFNLPLLLGASRKNFIGDILSAPVEKRLYGSLAVSIYAAMQGVGIIRTHDVGPTCEGLKVLYEIQRISKLGSANGEQQ